MKGRWTGQDFKCGRDAYKIYAGNIKEIMYFWKCFIDWRRILKIILKKYGDGCGPVSGPLMEFC